MKVRMLLIPNRSIDILIDTIKEKIDSLQERLNRIESTYEDEEELEEETYNMVSKLESDISDLDYMGTHTSSLFEEQDLYDIIEGYIEETSIELECIDQADDPEYIGQLQSSIQKAEFILRVIKL